MGEWIVLPNPDGSPTREADPNAPKQLITDISDDTITISTPAHREPE